MVIRCFVRVIVQNNGTWSSRYPRYSQLGTSAYYRRPKGSGLAAIAPEIAGRKPLATFWRP
jgi:hypothetical protein